LDHDGGQATDFFRRHRAAAAVRPDLESDAATVLLTFDLQLKKLMSGHPVVIETTARGDSTRSRSSPEQRV
jgi:hypothetical protein